MIPLVLLAGAMLGAGLWLLLFSLLPARPSLAASLARLRGDGAALDGGAGWPTGSPPASRWSRRCGRWPMPSTTTSVTWWSAPCSWPPTLARRPVD